MPAHNKSPAQEMHDLSIYLQGMADSQANQGTAVLLYKASGWLNKASDRICRHGIFGCLGGETCTSDHK